MHKAGLLGHCVRAWKSVRMASSRMTRRDLLANKVSLSLSTHRIGFAITRRLAQDGAHVVVNSWKQQNVDQAVATLQGKGLSMTGTTENLEQLVATAVKLHGGIDILVSNAAVSPVFGSLMDIAKEVWDKLWMDKEEEERMKETLQIRRLGEPKDCAGIVSFLRSEDASYITGETVVVGGGTLSHL
uniref:Uncharacterized protein n=1 Tax=Colobus angolensis palliatus TaxID=336983 RepID=A0A2K5J473_COLAP